MSSKTGRDRSRILVLIKGLGIGGAERLISEGSHFWDTSEFEYQVAYVLPWKDQLVGDLSDAGITVTCIGGSRGMDVGTPARFRRLVRDWTPDLVHAHLPSAGILSRVATKTPTIYTEHNIASSYRRPTQALNRATYSRNAAVIAVSDAVAASLRSYPGPNPTVIPNGVAAHPARARANVRAELGLTNETKLIVHVGNIRPHKGHNNLVAAAVVLSGIRSDFQIVSIGVEKNEGDIARLDQAVAEGGVESRIRFLGRRADALDFLAAADLVVNPSDVEGLPVTILEALILSRPVVATDVGGVATVVVDRETGLLVPPGEPESLAKAMSDALDSDDAAGWGVAGADLVRNRHSMKSMIGDYEAQYRALLNG